MTQLIDLQMITQSARRVPEPDITDFLNEQIAIEHHRNQAHTKFLQALPTVVELAKTDGSGGYVAATLLLNLYNGHAWQFNLVSLRGLDHAHWQACMDVLAYQAYTMPDKEIHHYIKNGNEFMQWLWKRYEPTANCIDKREEGI